MRSDRKLRRWYKQYNQKFFDNQLPADAVVSWEDCGPSEIGGTDRLADGRFILAVDPILRYLKLTVVARSTLLHEMAHVKLWESSPNHQHGPVFQEEMLRLARLGAFEKLW